MVIGVRSTLPADPAAVVAVACRHHLKSYDLRVIRLELVVLGGKLSSTQRFARSQSTRADAPTVLENVLALRNT
jgi:hypothetical protein